MSQTLGALSTTSRTARPSSASSTSATRSNAAAKTGLAAYSSRPIPARCAPCPANRKPTRAGRPASPVSTPDDRSPAASARAADASSPASAPSSTARCSNTDRVVASDQPTSTGSTSGPRSARRRAWAASASGVRAEIGQACGAPLRIPGRSAGTSAGAAGASSTTTWALVPLIPKPDTPARRGRSPAGQGAASVSSRAAPAVQSTCGEGSSACRVRGSSSCRSASTILITPATPAAAPVWAMFDFTDPSHTGRSAGRSWPYVASRACASMGSPSTVPVPCASTASTSPARNRALARAALITRCCAGPLGAVRPLDAPSWLTALPRITARMRWPLRRASETRSSSSMPAPSPQPVPSADAPKALQRPSAARPPCRENSVNKPGVAITVAPPASASAHSPERSAWAARWMATSEEEQAVSTVTAGPSRPSA